MENHEIMDVQPLKNLVSEGQIEQAIKALITFSESYYTELNGAILHTSARYNYLMRDKIKGLVSVPDYRLELNSITMGLLEIINSLSGLNPQYLNGEENR